MVDADHFVTDDTVFVAVTDATMNFAASAVTKVYVEFVCSEISVQPAGSALPAVFVAVHRNHLYAYDDGVSVHVPFVTVRICETALFPVRAGAAVFAGGRYCARTAPVDADHRVSEPEALEAFTEATMNLPTSLADNT